MDGFYVKKFLSSIDFLNKVTLVGGEAMQHPEFDEILEDIINLPKIGIVHIITNAVIMPSEKAIALMRNKRVYIEISGYGNNIPLKFQNRLKEFIKIISMRTNTVFVYQEQILRGQMSITAPPNFQVTAEDAFFFFEKNQLFLFMLVQKCFPQHTEGIRDSLPPTASRYCSKPFPSRLRTSSTIFDFWFLCPPPRP